MRIPDIHENQANKIVFGQFLENCIHAKNEQQVVNEIEKPDALKIKGLGPAVASILYFLHPTWIPPFNTAIINGFNYLFKDKKKLGSWSEYLKIRKVIMDMNRKHSNELSPDTGAFARLLFEIGTQKLLLGKDEYLSETERSRLEKLIEKRHKNKRTEMADEHLHNEMQYHLLKIGHALGYDVIAASNDRSKSWDGNKFSFISLADFPQLALEKEVLNTVKLIDVLWFQKGTSKVTAAFEVEKTTSIYSGILRLTDLSCSLNNKEEVLYLVVPDQREKDVLMQLSRPSIRQGNMEMKYICFSDLRQHCDALFKFGDDHAIMQKIARVAV
ncbi:MULTISPECIES: type II restriction endonuclease [unclassified Mucilaginibacter]|uniref:type II restriction endonuclease n=1 Tax=unclassified Mucilaginibacter TaxID=2617802 RepID=UPI002AC9165F|nr:MULTISPECIES: type II restriction endonuclease [unclassified Mucilaginibacter]MEB0262812.1 hypothetical protein [Mucilaginibacter sp. 10I4]MEB0278195.1 hypothetical protein [Mucilaginibacter sp. 10B2]MEB0302077.1 hypothetical protein [Mucilaginibacter sp. 5C4]WPX23841.1 type II restriction endonuclease [Mucilaginibacter sp. 5C4]